ncbi:MULTISPECIES: hypothetical protein [Virgibacillus]|uniref:Uncharacterized protein n=1 Tax=Virgibacillus kapii TaxID=1638645 RepID=A0ABQ2DCU0_9BACI|nr:MULTISPECIES: hypothetical protein [Virgibacillus]EQB38321.1 hypothetical protein M948_07000 [Virgibacillus sp. CM-4]MYL41027.1 hypothetical protein [Virgibacillus massiliensis]GGJ53671.1 hypothetical protein GCM10007111_14870 [Virgibacillus kapii]
MFIKRKQEKTDRDWLEGFIIEAANLFVSAVKFIGRFVILILKSWY